MSLPASWFCVCRRLCPSRTRGQGQAWEDAVPPSAPFTGFSLFLGTLGPHPEPVLHHRLRFPQVSTGRLGAGGGRWGEGSRGCGGKGQPKWMSRVHSSANVSPPASQGPGSVLQGRSGAGAALRSWSSCTCPTCLAGDDNFPASSCSSRALATGPGGEWDGCRSV